MGHRPQRGGISVLGAPDCVTAAQRQPELNAEGALDHAIADPGNFPRRNRSDGPVGVHCPRAGPVADGPSGDRAAATAPVPAPAPAQPAPPSEAAATTPPASVSPAGSFGQEQLNSLVAPIALYPDELLSQVLMASTYPLQVIEAARWVRNPANRALKGEAFAEALKTKGWDPSVMALVPFRRVLELMDSRLNWMRDLGSAFVAQQADVMAAVQRLRHLAMAAGNLKTTPQCHCVVSTEGETITIAAVEPGPVCIPVYNTHAVYGPWPYPAQPPMVFPIPVEAVFLPDFSIGFYPGVEVAWYWPLWGWGSIDWGAGHIVLDPARYSVLAARAPGNRVWAHDASRWGAVGISRAAASGRTATNSSGTRGGAARSYSARAVHGASGFRGAHASSGRWAGHRSYAARGGGHYGRSGHFAMARGPHGGGHYGRSAHFAMSGGGHFGGRAHFAMGGGSHGGGGGGGRHGH